MSLVLNLPSSPATHPARRRWLGTRGYWACQLTGWGAVMAALLMPLPFASEPSGWETFLILAAFALLGLLSSHLLRQILLHLLQRPRRLGPFVAWCGVSAFGLAAVVTALLLVVIDGVLRLTWTPGSHGRRDPPLDEVWTWFQFMDNLTLIFPLLFIWAGFYLGVRYYRQHQQAQLDRARAETAAREAELHALKAQLNPHFLFNSLNSLRALLPLDQEAPRLAVTRLAELLRASLTSSREPLIPLARELEAVENYLALEQLRHEARLRWTIAVHPSLAARPVPPLLVQGLVENAVQHGIGRTEAGGEIHVEGVPAPGGCVLRVSNPGRLGRGSASTGLGLANARSRLALLFGAAARLELTQAAADRVQAEVFLPAHPVGLSLS